METLWNDALGQYNCLDRTTGRQINSPSIDGILAVSANIPMARAAAISRRIETLAESCDYLIPSHDPTSPEFEGLHCWRGPVWLIVKYMAADGLEHAGVPDMIDRIMGDCLPLIEISGSGEYHDPITAEPCGGVHFTRTTAMVIEILHTYEFAA